MSKEPRVGADDLPPATVHRLLGHSYRLALLGCLDHHDGPIALADAAEWVACTVEEKALADIDAETVKRIYMSLYHSHIPRLEEHDVIEYHQEDDTVTLKDGAQLILYRHMCSPVPRCN